MKLIYDWRKIRGFLYLSIITPALLLIFAPRLRAVPEAPVAIIFDCDGVLVDSEGLKFEAWKQALQQHNIEFTLDEYIPLVGHTSEYCVKEIKKLKGDTFDSATLLKLKRAIYKNIHKKGVTAITPAVKFLKEVIKNKKSLNIKLGLASSAARAEILQNLSHIGINYKDFDAIISGRDDLNHFKDAQGTNKPKPYIYQYCSELLKINPAKCLVFEDSNAGVVAGATAGARVFAIPNKYTQNQDFHLAYQVIESFDRLNLKVIIAQI